MWIGAGLAVLVLVVIAVVAVVSPLGLLGLPAALVAGAVFAGRR